MVRQRFNLFVDLKSYVALKYFCFFFCSTRVHREARYARSQENVLSRTASGRRRAAAPRPRRDAAIALHTTAASDSHAVASGNILLLG